MSISSSCSGRKTPWPFVVGCTTESLTGSDSAEHMKRTAELLGSKHQLLTRLAAARASTFVGPQVSPHTIEQSWASLLGQRDDLGAAPMNQDALGPRLAPVLSYRGTRDGGAAYKTVRLRRGGCRTDGRRVMLFAEDLARRGRFITPATQPSGSPT